LYLWEDEIGLFSQIERHKSEYGNVGFYQYAKIIKRLKLTMVEKRQWNKTRR
jgi:hypothetical protein